MSEAFLTLLVIILIGDAAIAFGAAIVLWNLFDGVHGHGFWQWARGLIKGRSALTILLTALMLGHSLEGFFWLWAQYYRGGTRMPLGYSWRTFAGSTVDAVACWLFAGYLFGMWHKRKKNGN